MSSEGQTARYGYSDLTDTWYRVTEWEDVGDGTGKMIAKSKEEVPEVAVPNVFKGGVMQWSIEEGLE